MCWRPSWRDRPIYLTVSGCMLGVFGIVWCILWHRIFDKLLQMQLTISPNAIYYEEWKNPSDPVHVKVYLYNWTNPEEFTQHSTTKPIVKQCGPYSFTSNPEKVDIKWYSNNESVSYRRKALYYFDAAGSKGSLDDQIVALNAVAVHRHVIKTVDELLLSGYSDNFIALVRIIAKLGMGTKFPDRFGWLYGVNGSTDLLGVLNVHNGAKSATRRGQCHTWNYSNHTGFFESYCGMVKGSAGEFYPSNLKPDSVIYIFSPELCRSVPLEYTETVQVEGITGYKYVAGLRYTDNGTIYPENACYCGKKCYPSGITDVSKCWFNIPLFTSLPHFYQADPYYLNLVEGLEPNKNLHELYVIVEPHTGAPLEIVARFQVNMLVQPVENVRLYKNVPRVFFPLIWMESKFRIGPQIAATIKLIPYALWGGYVFASVIFVIGLIILLWHPAQPLCARANRNKSGTSSCQIAPAYYSKSSLPVRSENSVTTGYTLLLRRKS